MRSSMVVITFWASLALSFGCTAPAPEGVECGPSGECPEGQSCGEDHICRAGVVDARTSAVVDAQGATDSGPRIDGPAAIDAMTTTCASDMDCQSPPPCFEAGSCDLVTGTCAYPPKDCSAGSTVCGMSACNPATGACELMPQNMGAICGEELCDAEDVSCEFGSECAETGSKTVTCTVNECNSSGQCVQSAPYEKTLSCDRPTEGNACTAPPDQGGDDGDPTQQCFGYTSCGSFDDTCDEGGTQTRTCAKYACHLGACESGSAQSGQEQRNCSRNTDGIECKARTSAGCGSCSYPGGVCDETGSKTCSFNQPICAAGSCTGNKVETASESCSRNTDGDICGTCCIKGGTICNDYDCNSGVCSSPCHL